MNHSRWAERDLSTCGWESAWIKALTHPGDYDTISQFAKNADGDVIPRPLLERMIAVRDFGLGFLSK